jgi:hypothetical protein
MTAFNLADHSVVVLMRRESHTFQAARWYGSVILDTDSLLQQAASRFATRPD